MRNLKVLGAISAALLASVSTLAIAQDAGDRKGDAASGVREKSAPNQPPTRQGPAAQQRGEAAPTARGGTQPRDNAASEGKGSGSAGRGDERKGQSADTRKSDDGANRAAAQQSRDKREGARKSEQRRSEGADRAGKSAQQKSADDRQNQIKQSPRTTESSQPKSKSSDTAKGNDKGVGNRAAGRQESGDKSGSASSGASSGEGASRNESRAAGAPRLNDQQRTVIRERLFKERRPQAKSRNVNVHVTIGSPVPRGLSLAVLPSVIVQDVPEYRGYRYAIVEDEIVIVEPATSRVVEIIDRRGGARTAGTGSSRDIHLSAAEQRTLYDAVIRDFSPVDVRVKLGLGASIPQSVELDVFPRLVVDQLPQLQDYRFVVVEKEVLIVDPRNREIVLVVDG